MDGLPEDLAVRERETPELDPRVAEALPLSQIVTVTASAATLAACGGGGDDAGGPPTSGPPPPPPPAAPPITDKEAGKFLAQAAMGSSRADLDRVKSIGYAAWLDEQFAKPRATSHTDWLVAKGYADAANIDNENGFNPTMWRQAISGDDQLRQRVGLALFDFLVISISGLNTNWKQFAAGYFADVLWNNAFGNYRTLIEQVSLTPAMGLYLTFLGNRRAQGSSVPDENYAREVMQLFTIGLVRLNQDGSVAGGETYTQDDVTGLARVFTGFTYDSSDSSVPGRVMRPMAVNAAQHEPGVKTFLGTTIAAGTGGMASLGQALDTLVNHSNCAPFVSKQLIQRLVTSNPTPGYVARISGVFANNGAGVRGDLKAVVRAILLDSEARDAAVAAGPNFGKLRAPVNRLTAWARGFGVTSPSDAWGFGDTSSSSNRLAQSPGRAPSVFNFFRPGYTPPSTAFSAGGLVAPEFQITNEPSVVAYVNYMQALVQNGAGDAKADYSSLTGLAANSQGLMDEVTARLGVSLSASAATTIKGAIDGIDGATTAGQTNRIYTAVLLTLASPDFIAQK